MNSTILSIFYEAIIPYADAYVYLLIITIFVDFFTDIISSYLSNRTAKLTHVINRKRVIKDGLVIVLVLTFYIYCSIFEFHSYSRLIISFYIAHYGISVLENLTAMGIPVPEFIKKNIDKFK
ncbi:phage holin family protein [Carnobacterium sp.]|uniref:phage holin family protein n=1 Tax=Carnobacterium sp. TaxID=48221 RepID=UPI00388D417A